MAHRVVIDASRANWQVWDTRPGPRSKVSPGLKDGWLTFERIGEPFGKRRLSPIPDGWMQWSDAQLLASMLAAVDVPPSKLSIATVLEESSAPDRRDP